MSITQINSELVKELFKECNTVTECYKNNHQLLRIKNEIGVDGVLLQLINEKIEKNQLKILKVATDILEVHNKVAERMRLLEIKYRIKSNESRN